MTSVGLCDDRDSGTNRMERVDGERGLNGKRDSPVAHRLVLHVDDSYDQMSQLHVSSG